MARPRGRIQAGSDAYEPLPSRGIRKSPKTGMSSATKRREAPKPRPKPKNKNKSSNTTKTNSDNYGAMGQFPGVPYKDAARLVNPEIRAGLNDIRKDRRQLRRESKNDRERINALYQRSVGDLNHVFKESGDYIGHQNELIQGLYGDQRVKSEALQQQLLGTLQGQNQQSMGAINTELDRLGINQNNAGDQNRMIADQSFGLNVAHQTGANNMANIDAQALGASSIGNLLLGMNAGSKASRLGGAVNDRNDSMFEIQQNQIDGNNKVREAMSDMRGQRGDLTRQMLEQLAQTRWSQFIDSQQLDLAKKQARPKRRRGTSNRRNTRSSNSSYRATTSSGTNSSGSSKKSRGFFGSYNDSVMNNLR